MAFFGSTPQTGSAFESSSTTGSGFFGAAPAQGNSIESPGPTTGNFYNGPSKDNGVSPFVLQKNESLLSNGGFESASFDGWEVYVEGAGVFSVVENTAQSVPGGYTTAVNPDGEGYFAITTQTNPLRAALINEFTIPDWADSLVLDFDLFAYSAADLAIRDDLELDQGPNQHARVDILREGADPFSTSESDVLETLYLGIDGTTTSLPFIDYSRDDLLDVLVTGETYQLRFVQVDTEYYFNLGVDNVILEASGTNYPITIVGAATESPAPAVGGAFFGFDA